MSRDADNPIAVLGRDTGVTVSHPLHARLRWLRCTFETRYSKLHGRRYWCLVLDQLVVGALASDSPVAWRAEGAPRSLDRRALVRWLGRLAADDEAMVQGLRCTSRVLAAAIALCCDRSDRVVIDGATVDPDGDAWPGLLVSGNRGRLLVMAAWAAATYSGTSRPSARPHEQTRCRLERLANTSPPLCALHQSYKWPR